MTNLPACGSPEHRWARRRFLGALGGGLSMAGGLLTLTRPGLSSQLRQQDRRVVVFNMHGGMSQLESWDPKPGRDTGGPFRAIPTTVPGLHVSELLPYTSQQMHRLCLLRGVNTAEDDHLKGTYQMLTGRRQSAAESYPEIGAVSARLLAEPTQALPAHIRIVPYRASGRGQEAAYLGPQFSSIIVGGGVLPPNIERPASVSEPSDVRRDQLRRSWDRHFQSQRRTSMTDAYTSSYDSARQLMEQRDVFDIGLEPQRDRTRYGDSDFGRQCLLARRLIERGVSFVQVWHSNYDSHNENFDFHLELLEEFDRPFATFIEDLSERGLLEQTLVVVLSEFGRTPHINLYAGRDHYSKAWSVVMGGCGIAPGAVYGETNADGTEVVDGQVDHAGLFHTYLRAVGVDSSDSLVVDGREMPLADPAAEPIWPILA